MNPGPVADPNPLRARVAFAIMCFRFGISPQNPPNPQAAVPVDLSTDLARSIERQMLTSAARLFLQSRPFLPFTWEPTSSLDLFKNLNFQKYHALCWLQLQPRLTMRAEIEAAVRGAGRDASGRVEIQSEALDESASDEMFGLLMQAANAIQGENFSAAIVESIPLEG